VGWDKLASVDDNFSDVRNARRRNPITIKYRKPELGTFGIVNGTIIYISYFGARHGGATDLGGFSAGARFPEVYRRSFLDVSLERW
jgi:hypothetical protein